MELINSPLLFGLIAPESDDQTNDSSLCTKQLEFVLIPCVLLVSTASSLAYFFIRESAPNDSNYLTFLS